MPALPAVVDSSPPDLHAIELGYLTTMRLSRDSISVDPQTALACEMKRSTNEFGQLVGARYALDLRR